MNISRNPSTTIKPINARLPLPYGDGRAVMLKVIAEGKLAFENISGLTGIDANRAFFQVIGDRTFYSIEITQDEALAMGYHK